MSLHLNSSCAIQLDVCCGGVSRQCSHRREHAVRQLDTVFAAGAEAAVAAAAAVTAEETIVAGTATETEAAEAVVAIDSRDPTAVVTPGRSAAYELPSTVLAACRIVQESP